MASLWGIVLLVNSAAGGVGIFLVLWWMLLSRRTKSFRQEENVLKMFTFCLRYYFYSACLYLLTIMGVIGIESNDWISLLGEELGVSLFGIVTLFISGIFSLIYIFSSHNISYEDLELS
ncbi:hypothetical protein ACYSNQ_17055 [Enterococcus sp. LJL51]